MARTYKHLDIQERTIIEMQLKQGATPGAIASSLSRASLGWKAPAELFLPEGTFDFVKYWSTPNQPVLLPQIAARRAIEK